MVRIGRYTLDEFKLAKETHLDKQHFLARLNELVTGQIKMVKSEAEAYLKVCIFGIQDLTKVGEFIILRSLQRQLGHRH